MDMSKPKPQELEKGVWRIGGAMSATYLIVGSDKALVIDTGVGDVDVAEQAKEICGLPLMLVNTHCHGDHIGGNGYFPEFYIHPRDIEGLPEMTQKKLPVTQGYIFVLGGRDIEVMELPGHTRGSIALLDRANGLVFTGDAISDGPVFMVPGQSDAAAYVESLDRLLAMEGEITKVFCCHGKPVHGMEQVRRMRKAGAQYAAGELVAAKTEWPAGAELYINEDGCGFLKPAVQ